MTKFQILLKKKAFFLVGLALLAGGLFYAFSLPKAEANAADCGYVYQGEWVWTCATDDVGEPEGEQPAEVPEVVDAPSDDCGYVWVGHWVWMCQAAEEEPADEVNEVVEPQVEETAPVDPPTDAQTGDDCGYVWVGEWQWLCQDTDEEPVDEPTEEPQPALQALEVMPMAAQLEEGDGEEECGYVWAGSWVWTCESNEPADDPGEPPTEPPTGAEVGDNCGYVWQGEWVWVCETEEDDTSTSTDEGNTGGDNGSGENGSGEGDENHELDIFNEMFSNVNDTTWIEITWETNIPATSRVVYGTTSVSDPTPCVEADPENPDGLCKWGYEFTTVEDPTMVTEHTVRIEGLNPSTLYYMRPISHASPEEYGIELLTETTADNIPGGGGDGSSSGGSSSGSSSSGGSSSGGDGTTGTGGSVEPQVLGETIEATEGDDSVGGGEEEEEAPKEVLGEFTSLPEAGIDYSLYVLYLALGAVCLAGAGVLAYRR